MEDFIELTELDEIFVEMTESAPSYIKEVENEIDINIHRIEAIKNNRVITATTYYIVKETKAEIRQKIANAKKSYSTTGYLRTEDSNFDDGITTCASYDSGKSAKTIYELTLKKCRMLADIATDYFYELDKRVSDYLGSDDKFIEYTRVVKDGESNLELRLRIYKNFDVALWENDVLMIVNNQIQLHKKLELLLNGGE